MAWKSRIYLNKMLLEAIFFTVYRETELKHLL